jgi:hypothetical protein
VTWQRVIPFPPSTSRSQASGKLPQAFDLVNHDFHFFLKRSPPCVESLERSLVLTIGRGKKISTLLLKIDTHAANNLLGTNSRDTLQSMR